MAAEVDAVLAEFNGDARAVIAALLHDPKVLTADAVYSICLGYVRRDADKPEQRLAAILGRITLQFCIEKDRELVKSSSAPEGQYEARSR